jgi:hypothetical protein
MNKYIIEIDDRVFKQIELLQEGIGSNCKIETLEKAIATYSVLKEQEKLGFNRVFLHNDKGETREVIMA